mgnify:CR=1 FL=1
MLEDQIHGPFTTDFEPALATGAYVRIQPDDELREVTAVETIPAVETAEFTVPANGVLEEQEITALYAQDGVLAQLRLLDPDDGQAIPDDITFTVDHGGEESPRFNLKNERGFISSDTPAAGEGAPQTELFEWENTDLFFNFANAAGSSTTFTFTYSGWVYDTAPVSGEVPDITVLTERRPFRR